jgi:hypothetical protein
MRWLIVKADATVWRIYESDTKSFLLKAFITVIFLGLFVQSNAQKIESIHVNLYTDSLKKGTYNYINIDGKLADGKYLPLDSTDIIFTASEGKFFGNSLWIPSDYSKEKVHIKATLRSDPQQSREFDMYIKKIPNPDKLKSEQEILNDMKQSSGKKRS